MTYVYVAMKGSFIVTSGVTVKKKIQDELARSPAAFRSACAACLLITRYDILV